jgi:hypothetical protein
MNKLTVIGYLGIKRCYLNLSEEEIKKRYCNSECVTDKEFNDMDIKIIIIHHNTIQIFIIAMLLEQSVLKVMHI